MRILTNVPFPKENVALEKYNFDVTVIEHKDSHIENYKKIIGDYDIWIEMDPEKITKEVIEAGERLKWIHVGRVGFDGADLKAVKENRIIITNSKGCNHIPISEDVVLKMLMLSRDAYRYFSKQQEKKWELHAEEPLTGNADANMRILSKSACSLLGKTIGILGTGMIGKEIAKRVKGFGMEVCGYNRSGMLAENFDRIYTPESLYEMLSDCDYVVAAFPLTYETQQFCNKKFFSQMKPSAYFINISRGEVVNETDLIEALERGHIKGAAIDVTTEEPLPSDHELWETRNLIITPHQAWLAETTYQNVKDIISHNLIAYMEDGEMINKIRN